MTTTTSNKSAFPSFLICCTLLAASIFFLACDKDTTITPTQITEEIIERPDSINDLVAYLSSTMGTVLVDPEYQEQAVEMLELRLSTNGKYERFEVLPNGEIVVFYFDLKIVSAPELFFAAASDMKLDITPTRDDNGIWYRIWKNAQCGQKVDANSTGQCVELAAIDPLTGAIARQHQVGEKDYYYCKKGRETCLEKLRTVGETHFYDRLCKNSTTAAGQKVGTSLPYQQYTCEKD